MSNENFNSSDCLARLHKIAEEIPSGVREIGKAHKLPIRLAGGAVIPNCHLKRNEVESILPVVSSEELLTVADASIVSAVKQTIDDFWNNFNISEKLQNLKELQEKAPNNKAWRPTTGEVDVKPIVACALRERKKKLEEEIRRTKEELDTLTPNFLNFREKLEKQIVEINRVNDEMTKNPSLYRTEDSK